MRRSVLIVESNRAIQYLIRTILNGKYAVECVQNNRQAIQLFASGYETGMVVLDIPGVESENFELLEHISTSSIFNNVPIIVLSANREESLKISCLEVGASDFLTKPFDPVYLFEKADELLFEDMPDVIPRKRRIFNNMNIF